MQEGGKVLSKHPKSFGQGTGPTQLVFVEPKARSASTTPVSAPPGVQVAFLTLGFLLKQVLMWEEVLWME